jgi:hypothetical protein
MCSLNATSCWSCFSYVFCVVEFCFIHFHQRRRLPTCTFFMPHPSFKSNELNVYSSAHFKIIHGSAPKVFLYTLRLESRHKTSTILTNQKWINTCIRINIKRLCVVIWFWTFMTIDFNIFIVLEIEYCVYLCHGAWEILHFLLSLNLHRPFNQMSLQFSLFNLVFTTFEWSLLFLINFSFSHLV